MTEELQPDPDPIATGDTYKRTLTLGSKSYEFELRPLMAGDKADLQDEVRIQIARESDGDEEDSESFTHLRMGTMRILTVTKALQSWSLQPAISVASVRALHPDLFDKLYAEVSFGGVPPEQSEEEKNTGSPLHERSASQLEPVAD